MEDENSRDPQDNEETRSLNRPRWAAYIPEKFWKISHYPRKFLGWLHHKINGTRVTVLNLLVLLTVLAGAWALISEVRREQIIIQPILVPDELENVGITGEVIARWIRDEIESVQKTASTTRRRALYISGEDLPDITVGNTGFTLRSVVGMARHLFSDTTKQVSGEIVIRQVSTIDETVVSDCRDQELHNRNIRFMIRLRTSFGENTYWPACGNNIEQLTAAAAQEVIRLSNPYVLASYHFELSQREANPESSLRAEELAKFIIRERPREEHKWAMNLLGLISANNNELKRAITHYAQIEQQGHRFSHAYTNWGTALAKMDPPNHVAAIEKYRTATEIDPQSSAAFFNWGLALTRINPPQYEAALKKYRSASEIDPRNEDTHFQWGVVLLILGMQDAAIEKFRKTTEINPDHAGAFHNWGVALLALGRSQEAIEKLGIATEIDPQYISAFENQGRACEALKHKGNADKLFFHAECLRSSNHLSECPFPDLH